MTAELVRGQNHPLTGSRLQVRISAGHPVMAAAALTGEDGTVPGPEWVAHPGSPRLPGAEVPGRAAAEHVLTVDLDAVPAAAHRLGVLLALVPRTAGPTRFGALAAPYVAVATEGGEEIAGYTVTGLDAETAVVAVELYRRQGAWKVRAVGQGYAEGLAALLRDHGLPGAAEAAAAAERALAGPSEAAEAAAAVPSAAGEREATTAAVPSGPAADAAGAADGPAVREAAGPAPAGDGAAATVPTSREAAAEGASGASSGPISYRHPGRRGTSAAAAATAGTSSAAPSAALPPGTVPEGGHAERSGPVAGDATGWSMDERLYNQVRGMFEDLARAVAAYRSAVDFAESRLDRELDQVLTDPATRVGPAADAARQEARDRHRQLVEQARAVLDRDLAQLAEEAEVVEHALPPSCARWDHPVWQGYQVPLERPLALRLGDVHLPERTDLRIPLLVRLPLERGLWVDAGRPAGGPGAGLWDPAELRASAAACAVNLAVRLLAVHPVGDCALHVIDPAGAAGTALAPLLESGALREAPAAGARGVSGTLERLTRRVDLVQMAVRNRALDSLPDDVDTGEQVLLVNDFPHGFDDRAVTQLRYLVDEGPSVGVHVVLVADRDDARAYGPVLDPLWRSLLRLTPVPDDHLADPWVGHAWTYEPPVVPPGSDVVRDVLRKVGQSRRAYGI
ncbi:TerD family protein [Streptomyces sp. NPDC049585]|uniref:TerD family protein n=1 Tax=Streptomyces sp. NPDC049585 TaxID=3155154 RepID=UPI0034325BA0